MVIREWKAMVYGEPVLTSGTAILVSRGACRWTEFGSGREQETEETDGGHGFLCGRKRLDAGPWPGR